MTDLADADYFTDAEIAQHPYEYWDHLRSQGPVFREPHYGVVAVTGYQEVQAAFKDVDSFSAVNAKGMRLRISSKSLGLMLTRCNVVCGAKMTVSTRRPLAS